MIGVWRTVIGRTGKIVMILIYGMTGTIVIGMIGVWRTVIGRTGTIVMIIHGIGMMIGKMRVGMMIGKMIIINIYGMCNAMNGCLNYYGSS